MANGKISKITCDAAFYDDRHRRRRRDVGDSRGGPHPRPVTPRARQQNWAKRASGSGIELDSNDGQGAVPLAPLRSTLPRKLSGARRSRCLLLNGSTDYSCAPGGNVA
jgi:hypothetical protein